MTAYNSVYISSSCFPFRNLSEMLNYCGNNNLYNIELGCNLDYEEDVNSIFQKFSGFNFLVHNYFPIPKLPFTINLASVDETILKQSIVHCKKAIDLCNKLGVPFFSVHSGFLSDFKPKDLGSSQKQYKPINRKTALKIFEKSIRLVLGYAENKKINLLIENNIVEEFNLINGKNELYLMVDTDEILNFFKGFNNPKLGLLADLGHLNVSANLLKFDKFVFLKKLSGHIRAFHLSRNNAKVDQNLPFDKNEWFIPILRQKEFQELPKVLELNKSASLTELLNYIKII